MSVFAIWITAVSAAIVLGVSTSVSLVIALEFGEEIHRVVTSAASILKEVANAIKNKLR